MSKAKSETITDLPPEKGYNVPSLNMIVQEVMRILPHQLSVDCRACQGKGKVHSDEWNEWWETHKSDWKRQVSKGNLPPSDEKIDCVVCKGQGIVGTKFAIELLNAMQTAKDLEPLKNYTFVLDTVQRKVVRKEEVGSAL